MNSAMIINGLLPEGSDAGQGLPQRKHILAAPDNGTFIKPLKQCFIKNARLMPGTRIMLAMLAGWAGQGGAIETTMCAIGRHVSRSRRQIFRYLQDAANEGYLVYSKTQNRMGYVTGIKVWLNFAAIAHKYKSYIKKKDAEYRTNQAVTQRAENNHKQLLLRDADPMIGASLERLARAMGIPDTPLHDPG